MKEPNQITCTGGTNPSVEQCDQRFNSKVNFNEHKRTTHNLKPVQCPMCDFSNSSEDEVSKHIEHNHPDKNANPSQQFKCIECRYETNSTNKLKNHMSARQCHMQRKFHKSRQFKKSHHRQTQAIFYKQTRVGLNNR